MAMARKTTAMAITALLLLGALSILPGAAIAEASMPALLAHIQEIQRLSKTAHREAADFDQPEQPDYDFAASLGLADSSANEPVEEEDGTNGFFAHVSAVQRKMQEEAAEFGRLNSEERPEVLVEGISEENLEEELEERDGEVDALVQKRFDQLEAALKTLNDENDGESMELSADGGEGDDAINSLLQFVQERQQELEVENDQIFEVAFGEHEGVSGGHGNKHGDHERFHGRDHTDGDAGEGMDALVLERFNQLEAALKILNDEDGVERMRLSADGGEGDDAINLLHHFVQERQQKRHQELQLENDPSHETAAGEHEGIGRGHGSKHDEHERFDGVMDALVLERFDQLETALDILNNRLNQLEAALEILNDRAGVERMQLSADGGEGDDAINLLHHFVQERQQQHGGLVV